ncbi:MAG: prolyl oligopeptidase family serine peptidase [Acidobacteria bacterium]|nr:prolyl oligopeptidase family serine peptidase [Acidobacteriota bacterium]
MKPKGGMEREAGPPPTRREEVSEELHGVRISDPFRWLEGSADPEVLDWTAAQNRHTAALLGGRPGRERTRSRLATLLAIGVQGRPVERGGRYFHMRREGADQNQPILYVREGVGGTDRALVDPNRLREDGTAAIDWWFPSVDGRLLACGVSEGGDEKSTLRVYEVETGRPLPDVIPRTRYCSLAWLPDGSGFLYTRYPAPGEVEPAMEDYNRHLFRHRLGEDPTGDRKLFGEGRDMEEMLEIDLSPDGRHLVVMAFEGWTRSDLFVIELADPSAPCRPIAEGIDAIFRGEVIAGVLYLLTNWQAPRYRLLAVDLNRPEPSAWREIIPEGEGVLEQAVIARSGIVAHTMRDASSSLSLHRPDGAPDRGIELPQLGTIDGLSGRHDSDELFFGFSSTTIPPTVHRLDVRTGATSVWERVEVDLDLGAYEVRQVFYRSKDGTRVPMIVAHRRDLLLDGSNPTLLYGYGGFNVSLTPVFSRALTLWLERGGVYAQASLRGGREYGEEWHRSGMRSHKQNVFDDFIAAAEWLVGERYTRPERLAIRGGSNGGLLAGAVITQRPDLFRAAIISVPLLDMIRYHRFLIARLWIPEIGSAESPVEFHWLRAYSPYHRVEDGVSYPAVLLTTAAGDSRVDPMHARKMAARLQEATASGHPVLLRVGTRAGHGAGKPLSKLIEESTDDWTFLFWQLGMEEAP